MKLTYLIEGLGPGGAERSLVELLPHYAAAGIETTIVHLKHRPTGFEAEARGLDCALHRLEGVTMPARIAAFRRYIADEQPDLVHTSLLKAHLIGRMGAWRTGVPVLSSLVNTSYDPVRKSDPNLNQRGFRLVKAVDGFTARHFTAHFHAITHAVKASYVEQLRLDPERITVVERGRSRERLGERTTERRATMRARLDIDPRRPVLVNVGRQEYQKGHRFLVEAMAEVVREHPDVLLLMVGHNGSQTSVIEETVARLGLEPYIQFLGYRDDVTDIVAASDVFVFPSLFEGLGGAVLEAMGLGLPVVASDIPVLREVLGADGYFAAPGAPGALARAVSEAVAHPEEASRRGARGQTRFENLFTIDKTAARMINMYESVASVRREPATASL